MKIPKTDLDYIDLYAEKLKENPSLFKKQKELIESQLESSSALFKKRFSNKNFKTNARNYLKVLSIV
jgi:hypothetical protein